MTQIGLKHFFVKQKLLHKRSICPPLKIARQPLFVMAHKHPNELQLTKTEILLFIYSFYILVLIKIKCKLPDEFNQKQQCQIN